MEAIEICLKEIFPVTFSVICMCLEDLDRKGVRNMRTFFENFSFCFNIHMKHLIRFVKK